MIIILNGKEVGLKTKNPSLSTLISELALPSTGVAFAVGTKVIPKKDWETYSLVDGEKITMIKATQGG